MVALMHSMPFLMTVHQRILQIIRTNRSALYTAHYTLCINFPHVTHSCTSLPAHYAPYTFNSYYALHA